MACQEKFRILENPQKISPEETQQVVSKELEQRPPGPSGETPFKKSEEAPAEGQWCKIKKTILTFLLCAFVFVTGCATITKGKYQNIPVTSEPPGVKVSLDTGASIITPGSFDLRRNRDHTLVAEYAGCELQQKELKHKLQGLFWCNILLCSIVGSIVDLASGACYELYPEEIHFDFTSAGQAVASRQRSYLESHPETNEKVRFSILNGLATKGMTKEELMASLGKPHLIDQEGKSEVFVYNSCRLQRYYLKNGILKKIE